MQLEIELVRDLTQEQDPQVLDSSTNVDLMPRADLPAIWSEYQTPLDGYTARYQMIVAADQAQPLSMTADARELRIAIKRLRVQVDKRRKDLGEDKLAEIRRINSAATLIMTPCVEMMDALEEIEKAAEIAEAKRLMDLITLRTDLLRNVGATIPANLGEIPDAVFEEILFDARDLHEFRQKQQAERAAAKAEEERLAAIERARVAEENARLRKEREAADAAHKAELAAAAQKAAAEKAEAQKELDEVRRLTAESNERARRILAQQAEREAKEKADAAKAARAAKKLAAAPDQEKIIAYVQAIKAVPLPMMSTEEGADALAKVIKTLAGTYVSILDTAAAL